MEKTEMLNAIIRHCTGGNKAQFANILGVTPQTISSWLKRNTFDIELIFAKCEYLNPAWLLSNGKGAMLKESSSSQGDLAQVRSVCSSPETSIDSTLSKPEAIPFAEAARNGLHPIPLVTRKAAAGFGNGDFSIEEADVKEYYVIPKFKYCHVDFMIEVSGLSMYPHFNPGDVIACSILRSTQFLQWNKCHVIATREQGILVKRLMPGEDKNIYAQSQTTKNIRHLTYLLTK